MSSAFNKNSSFAENRRKSERKGIFLKTVKLWSCILETVVKTLEIRNGKKMSWDESRCRWAHKGKDVLCSFCAYGCVKWMQLLPAIRLRVKVMVRVLCIYLFTFFLWKKMPLVKGIFQALNPSFSSSSCEKDAFKAWNTANPREGWPEEGSHWRSPLRMCSPFRPLTVNVWFTFKK